MELTIEEKTALEAEAKSMDLEELRERYIELSLETHEWAKQSGNDEEYERTAERREVFYAELETRSALASLAPLLSTGIPVLEYNAAGILAKVEPTGAFREAAYAKLDYLASQPYGYISGWAEALMNGIRYGTPFPTREQVEAHKAS